MKLREEIKAIKTDTGSLRNFAWIVGGIFLVIGMLPLIKGGSAVNFFSILGAILIAAGVIAPRMLKYIYLGWMLLGLVMGLIVSPVMFSLLYFIAVTPIALVMRLTGKKFLDFTFDRSAKSYWKVRQVAENSRQNADNQF